MPIYEFKCKECGKVSEVLFRSWEGASGICPQCGSSDTERLLSGGYSIRTESDPAPGATCCGRTERCDSPPCSTTGSCRRD